MSRGMTLIELVIVVLILGVLANMGLPAFQHLINEAKFREIRDVVYAARDAAKFYDAKYGITNLPTVGGSAEATWQALLLDFPENVGCYYRVITVSDKGVQQKKVETFYPVPVNPDMEREKLLYTWTLPDGGGKINWVNPYSRYIAYMPDTKVESAPAGETEPTGPKEGVD